MKRKMISILSIALVCILLCQMMVSASDITLFNNNTSHTATNFSISSTGKASVTVRYIGYSGITTGATISVKIEKRTLLFFWSDIVEQTYSISGYQYGNVYEYQLEDTGTYRCTVVYTISGTGGADDVISFEDTSEY